MRLTLLLAFLFAGCTALDDFGVFHFDGGALDGAGDLSGGAPFGAACMPNGCMQPNTVRTVDCVSNMAGTTFPGGMCTHVCVPGPGACGDFPDATCELLNNVGYCLPKCIGGGTPCRSGYDCCINNGKANNGEAGACAPSDSTLCR